MKVIILIVAIISLLVLFRIHKRLRTRKIINGYKSTQRKSIGRRFKIAGVTHRCSKKDIGIVKGKVGYDPTNEKDPNAIAIIANIGESNEKLLGFIPRDAQITFRNFAYKENDLPFVGFIEHFISDSGRKVLFGKIRAYIGTNENIEADMENDIKFLKQAFKESDYKKRMEMLDIW